MMEHYSDKLRFWLSVLLMMLIVSVIGVYAQVNATDNSTQYCFDENILTIEATREICIAGQCDTVERVWNQNCEYGCDDRNNICFPAPYIRYGGLIIVIVLLIVGILLAWRYL